MTRNAVWVLVLSASFAVEGCSSASKASGGLDAPTPEPSATDGAGDVNPYGVAYPTGDVGIQARSGDRAGNRIKNYRFAGYANSDKSAGLGSVSLANYYDPEGRNHKIIHLIASSVWCGPCNQETQAVVAATARLEGKGVVFVQALIDGPTQGTAATQKDLDGWIARYGMGFTTMLDPDVKNLGQFFRAAAVPWNAIIDARSMEILQAEVGGIADVDGVDGKWLQWVEANPAKE
jgi:hypothetical protein